MSEETRGSSAGSARATEGGRFGRGAQPPSEGKHDFSVIGRPLAKIDAWATAACCSIGRCVLRS